MSAARSSMCSLQPSCSPKKATLGPMTGPQSTSTGDSHDDSAARNFGSAFDGTMASAVAADGEVSTPPPAWSGRLPPNFSRSVIATELTWTARRFTAPGHDGPCAASSVYRAEGPTCTGPPLVIDDDAGVRPLMAADTRA